MARFKEKNLARELRFKGDSILEIANQLGISKSTVSIWCRDIILTKKQIERLVQKRSESGYLGRLKAAEIKRKNRLAEIADLKDQGIKEIGKIRSKRELLLAGLGVYLGEGDKSLSQTAITSASPKIILLMIRWFKEVCQISTNNLVFRIALNESHLYRQKDVEKYWADLTGVSLNQFTKTVIIKTVTKKVYSNPNNYYGTLRIKVRRSTRLQRKILGWLEGLTNFGALHVAE